jgi:hypothetical protein
LYQLDRSRTQPPRSTILSIENGIESVVFS